MSGGYDERRPRQEAPPCVVNTDSHSLSDASDILGHCCQSLSIEQREHLGRRGLFCSESRCGRALLLSEVSL